MEWCLRGIEGNCLLGDLDLRFGDMPYKRKMKGRKSDSL
jgi:hypothetical protein